MKWEAMWRKILVAVCMLVCFPYLAAADTLQKIKDKGEIIIGVRFDTPPLGFVDSEGKNSGFDIDIANELAKRLGVKVQFVQVTAQTRIPMLETEKVDVVIAAMTQTRKREEVVDFSIRYFTDGQKLLVRQGSGIKSLEDLAGKRISTVQGSTNEAVIREASKNLNPAPEILVYQEWPQAFLALKQGRADALESLVLVLAQFSKEEPNTYEIVGPFLDEEPLAIALRQNDSAWRDALNAMLQDMERDGTYGTLFNKWFGKESGLNLPTQHIELWP